MHRISFEFLNDEFKLCANICRRNLLDRGNQLNYSSSPSGFVNIGDIEETCFVYVFPRPRVQECLSL